jgi:hypothetical protein
MRKLRSSAKIRRELRSAGASDKESDHLAALAIQISQLTSPEVPRTERMKPYLRDRRVLSIAVRSALYLLSLLIGLLVGILLASNAQPSTPDSWLYPIKKLTEHLALHQDPEYRTALMMRRAQEVAYLVEAHSSTQNIMVALAAYKKALGDSKSSSYPALAYCKDKLEQAEKQAHDPERQAIANMLDSLKNVD